jgi:HSP20 family protein
MVWNALMRGAADPWRELERLHRQMDRYFTDPFPAGELPPIELWTGADGVRLHARIPGVSAADIDLSVVDDTVTLKGERRVEETGGDVAFHRRERELGRFARTIQLPFPVDADAVVARFQDGILEVELPRAASDKPRKISIRGAQ